MANILLVDDSKTLLKHISRMLIAGGHSVVAKKSGHEATEHLKQHSVDLVLTDLYMPQTDGFELVQKVRELANRPPLIVMSSNVQAYSVFRDAQALGAAAALHKPFTAEQLLATVENVLRGIAPAARPDGPVPFEVAI